MSCTLLYFTYLGFLVASLKPTFLVASVLSSFFYTLLNLFAGFPIPGPKMPKWWVWAYWICPTSWSLKALLTSQYGDVKKQVIVFGERKAIDAFLKSYYAYDYDDLTFVAFVLIAYLLVFCLWFFICYC